MRSAYRRPYGHSALRGCRANRTVGAHPTATLPVPPHASHDDAQLRSPAMDRRLGVSTLSVAVQAVFGPENAGGAGATAVRKLPPVELKIKALHTELQLGGTRRLCTSASPTLKDHGCTVPRGGARVDALPAASHGAGERPAGAGAPGRVGGDRRAM